MRHLGDGSRGGAADDRKRARRVSGQHFGDRAQHADLIGRARAATGPEQERLYVAALAKRYSILPQADRKALNVDYKNAMGELVRRYPDDLDAATVQNVVKFHETYYRPDNATLIVVGDFDPKQLDAWVDKYFATITKPNLPLPRVQVTEPARTSPKLCATMM